MSSTLKSADQPTLHWQNTFCPKLFITRQFSLKGPAWVLFTTPLASWLPELNSRLTARCSHQGKVFYTQQPLNHCYRNLTTLLCSDRTPLMALQQLSWHSAYNNKSLSNADSEALISNLLHWGEKSWHAVAMASQQRGHITLISCWRAGCLTICSCCHLGLK